MSTHFTMQDCIDNCQQCHRICVQTLAYALRLTERRVHETHLRLLMDCADICETSANFMLRESDLHRQVCRACAAICERCAEFCGEMREDAQMRLCEQVCLRCTESCAQMAAA